MLLGSAAAPAASKKWPRERLLGVAIGAVGLVVMIASQVDALSAACLLWVLSGFVNAIGNFAYNSVLQERTPDGVRGRVMGAAEGVMSGTYLVGAAVTGWLGAQVGIRFVYALSGLIFIGIAAASRVLLRPSEWAAGDGGRLEFAGSNRPTGPRGRPSSKQRPRGRRRAREAGARRTDSAGL